MLNGAAAAAAAAAVGGGGGAGTVAGAEVDLLLDLLKCWLMNEVMKTGCVFDYNLQEAF